MKISFGNHYFVVRDGIKINRRGYAFASKLYSKSVEKILPILLTNCLYLYVSLPRVAGLQNLPASPLLVLI